jgi:hypothetical protein
VPLSTFWNVVPSPCRIRPFPPTTPDVGRRRTPHVDQLLSGAKRHDFPGTVVL